MSENQIFATVSALDPTGVAFSRHRVVSRRVINSRGSELPATMTHWPQTDSRLPLRLGSASSQTVAIHQEREGRWLSTLLQLSETRAAKHDGLEDNYPVLCTLAEGSTGLLGIYRDVVVWREQGVDNLRFLDVNKDNDFVLDAGDWFPVTGSAMFDSDNDGISDEADIITVGGSCTRSERRSACISDITILYLVWMSYVILVNIPVFFITRWYLVHKRILRERAKHANIVDENQMYFVREVRELVDENPPLSLRGPLLFGQSRAIPSPLTPCTWRPTRGPFFALLHFPRHTPLNWPPSSSITTETFFFGPTCPSTCCPVFLNRRPLWQRQTRWTSHSRRAALQSRRRSRSRKRKGAGA